MQTRHTVVTSDSRDMSEVKDQSVDLVVTSPPYPMITMWDELFIGLSDDVKQCLKDTNGNGAFEAMHRELDKVWYQVCRVLKPGSFACINIGDATRTIGKKFAIYSNHSRIVNTFLSLGFDCLPCVIWRKPTNAPNKFMGSGMLPSGAYVTLEHEYILVFRKGMKREFKTKDQKLSRMKSAFFWEERNKWFSDVWDFIGTTQSLKKTGLRERSGAYPFELAMRCIAMYSLYGDCILDPFMGTGTTLCAALATGRNSIGIEIEKDFCQHALNRVASCLPEAEKYLQARILSHKSFVKEHMKTHGSFKYHNKPHGFAVKTQQEKELELKKVSSIEIIEENVIRSSYQTLGSVS